MAGLQLVRELTKARADLVKAEVRIIALEAEHDALQLRVKDLEHWEWEHRRYSADIAKLLEPFRQKRETGEPAQSDKVEIEQLIAELRAMRWRSQKAED